MLRTFQFRLFPNEVQKRALLAILLDNCETYNAALQERREAWKLQRKSITYYMQQKELTELRKDKTFQWVACDIMRDPLRRVEKAFDGFFQRCKNGEKPGYPRFKSCNRYDSFSFQAPFIRIRPKHISVPKLGFIKMRGGRSVVGKAKVCTVKRDGKRRWMLYIVCDIGAAPTKINVSRSIGIDVGLTTLATLSNGQSINNPRWTRKHEAKIAAASRKLALKQKRSKNSARASELLRRAYQRSANTRINYIHHISKLLTQSYDLIAYENLNIESMVRSAKGTVDKPGKNVAQKSGLNKSIMDAAWGILIYQIAYKAESAGKWAIAVNPRGTTQLCSGCGGKVPKSISERRHKCLDCGLDIGRDHNAAINILRLGMSLAGLKDPSEYTNNLCINSRREYRA